MQTRKRPTSLTVIAVIFIVWGGYWSVLSIYGLTVLLRAEHNMPKSSYIILLRNLIATMFGAATNLISGPAILRGFNWGRWLYLGLFPFSGAFTVISKTPFSDPEGIRQMIMFAVVYYIICLVILTRPGVSEFFRKETVDEPETSSC